MNREIRRESILAAVRVVRSHLRGDRRPVHGQLGDLTLPARCLALVTITRVRTENQVKFLAQLTEPQVLVNASLAKLA